MKSIYNMLPPIIDSAKQFQDEILKSYQQIDFEELSNKLNNIYASTYSYDLGETFYDDVNKCVNTFNSNPQNYNINDYKEIEKTIKELTKNYTNLTSITSNANLEYYKTLGNITFVVIIFSIIYFIISNPIMFNLTSEDMANLIDIISTIVNFLSLFK